MSTNFYEPLITNDYIVDRDLGKYKKTWPFQQGHAQAT